MYRDSWLPEVFNNFIAAANMPKVNATAPAINVKELQDKYEVEVAAPGLSKDNFTVHINADGDLTIKMENKSEHKEENGRYLRREFVSGSYEQTLVLPDDVDKDKIAAHVADGILTVDLPKLSQQESKVARQIEIG